MFNNYLEGKKKQKLLKSRDPMIIHNPFLRSYINISSRVYDVYRTDRNKQGADNTISASLLNKQSGLILGRYAAVNVVFFCALGGKRRVCRLA